MAYQLHITAIPIAQYFSVARESKKHINKPKSQGNLFGYLQASDYFFYASMQVLDLSNSFQDLPIAYCFHLHFQTILFGWRKCMAQEKRNRNSGTCLVVISGFLNCVSAQLQFMSPCKFSFIIGCSHSIKLFYFRIRTMIWMNSKQWMNAKVEIAIDDDDDNKTSSITLSCNMHE